MIRPNVEPIALGRRLHPGDLVRFVSPASAPEQQQLAAAVAEVQRWGLEVQVAPHALARHGFMAGTDDDRLADLNDAFRDPEVRAVFATRGGAGSYRIAHRIDVDAVRSDPKPVVGFSDITNVQVALWSACGLVSIHGSAVGEQTSNDVRSLLLDGCGLTIEVDPSLPTSRLRRPGQASGPLVGGNLREIAGLVGAGLRSLAGAIVFLEDLRHVGLGQVDRNLTQLRRSGALDGIAGIVLGHFDGFDGYEDAGWTVIDVLADQLGALGVPLLGGIRAGHGLVDANGQPDQRALTLGSVATLDTERATVTVGACVR